MKINNNNINMWRIFERIRKKLINFIIIFMDFGVGIFSFCYEDEKLTTKIVNLFHCVAIMILNVLHEVEDISSCCCKKKKAQEKEKGIDEEDIDEFEKRSQLMRKDVEILREAKETKAPKLVELSKFMKMKYKEWKALMEEPD